MTTPQDQSSEIVIAGLDVRPEDEAGDETHRNVTPTDEGVARQMERKPRGEPQDEDG